MPSGKGTYGSKVGRPKTLMHGLANELVVMFTQRVIIQTLSTFATDSQ